MYSESSKFERPSQRLSLDSFHEEGLPIPSPFDTHSDRSRVIAGDQDDHGFPTNPFGSPDIDQKASQNLLVDGLPTDLPRSTPAGFDFYSRPAAVPSFDAEDLTMSPAAMFLSAFSPPTVAVSRRAPDEEGEVVSGYKLGQIIGVGGFSTIRKASSSSGGTVAIKIVKRSDLAKQGDAARARKRLDDEAATWLSLSHEHILPLFSALHNSYADFFITLYCPAGTLFDILKRDGRPALPQDDVGMMFRQVVRGLLYLHEVARLVHRDIKLENILVDEMGVCRIGDFGMTRNIGDLDAYDSDEEGESWLDEDPLQRAQSLVGERRPTFAHSKRQTKPGLPVHLSMIRQRSGPRYRNSTPAGTSSKSTQGAHQGHFQAGSLPYAAPELLMTQFSAPLPIDPAQDIWALGVTLYGLLTGRLPFNDSFEPRLQMKILNGVYEVPPDIGRGAELVLQGCLDRTASTRWTIAMVDEVAWGVGWGEEESGSSSPQEEEIESFSRAHRSASQSKSISRPRTRGEPSGPAPLNNPSVDAARRRSTSRASRSASRASVSDRSRSESSRRHSPHSHSHSALEDSFIGTGSTSSESYVPFYDPHHESALLTSPPRGRGRWMNLPHVQAASRSPSPSMVPATPIDFIGGRELPPLDDDDVIIEEEEESDGLRGRPEIRTPRALDASVSEALSNNDEDAPIAGISLISGLTRRINPFKFMRDENHGRGRGSGSGNVARAGSTPPMSEDTKSLQSNGRFLREETSSSGLLGVAVTTAARSRSVGCDDALH